jgi:hypothetical protein
MLSTTCLHLQLIHYDIGNWRRLHNEESHNLYITSNVIMMINSRKMQWTGHAASTTKLEVHAAFSRKYFGKKKSEMGYFLSNEV